MCMKVVAVIYVLIVIVAFDYVLCVYVTMLDHCRR